MPYKIDQRPGASTDKNSGLMLYALGWKDILASFASGKTAGANVPAWSQVRDGLYGYEFTATQLKEVWVNFHIGHDYAPGTDLFPHVHFVPLTDEVEGTVRWGVEYAYADRDTGVFGATTTIYIEQVVTANSQYVHIVSECLDEDRINGAGDAVSVDGVLMCRYFRDGAHANDTYAGSVVGIFADLHYQSDRDTTLNKAPDFYA